MFKKETNFKLNLGDEVEDIITGYSGIIVSRSQWLHNCNTYGVRSRKLKDDKPIETHWFDEPQLQVLSKKVIEEKRDTGGPCQAVPSTNRS